MVAHRKVEYNHPYLKQQLIAYIGNKRRLLPFIGDVLADLHRESPVTCFADPFAGSGAVARLAKFLGFEVFANDWELYSYILNSCHIATEPEEEVKLFGQTGGLVRTLNMLMEEPRIENGYIASFYSPRSTETADYRRERLFYTRENGEFIDTVRTRIEELYPGSALPPLQKKEKNILLASLLYQAATHANTSGVFKACHKGFGGHGKDALFRITSPMALQKPLLISGRGRAGFTDACSAVRGNSTDICYLDPPYNQHQYGSNYHLLNTIAKWDKPRHPLILDETGRLRDKGGIRRDWTETRSDFCYKETALPAFTQLVGAIDARFIVLSYNTEGIILYEDILEVLDKRGSVELFSSDYVKYRGGRQSDSRKTYNVEFLMVCKTSEMKNRANRQSILRFFLQNKIRTMMRRTFYPEKIRRTFLCSGGTAVVCMHDTDGRLGGRKGYQAGMDGYAFFTAPATDTELGELKTGELQNLYDSLARCCVETKQEECEVLLRLLRDQREHELNIHGEDKLERLYEKKLIQALKKIAHKKYQPAYNSLVQKILRFGLRYFEKEFVELTLLAEKRFIG